MSIPRSLRETHNCFNSPRTHFLVCAAMETSLLSNLSSPIISLQRTFLSCKWTNQSFASRLLHASNSLSITRLLKHCYWANGTHIALWGILWMPHSIFMILLGEILSHVMWPGNLSLRESIEYFPYPAPGLVYVHKCTHGSLALWLGYRLSYCFDWFLTLTSR